MFFHHDLKGTDLPPRTLCLTYDDGPGPETLELGRYLYAEGIAATFFVIGRHAEGQQEALGRLHAWGHLIGNHTYSHPGLVKFVRDREDAAAELERTEAIIRPFRDIPAALFRPPYGNWRDKTSPDGPEDVPNSPVADTLNRSAALAHYVGPVKWEIVGEDWACWQGGLSPGEAARRHLEAVERVGRGIVLMHDSSENQADWPQNRTMEMTKILIPMLRTRGYQFVRLDEAPQVRAAVRRMARG